MKKYRALMLGGMLAGSLIGSAAPAFSQTLEFVNDRFADRRELRMDRRALDRDYDQLRADRETLDRHLRYGANPRQIARDRDKIREDEAKIRRDEAELRHDRGGYARNDWEWRYNNSSDRFNRFE